MDLLAPEAWKDGQAWSRMLWAKNEEGPKDQDAVSGVSKKGKKKALQHTMTTVMTNGRKLTWKVSLKYV